MPAVGWISPCRAWPSTLSLSGCARARLLIPRYNAPVTVRDPRRVFQVLLHHPAVGALLEACGDTECHLVGGVLRDRALGIPSHDFDAVVAARGREIGERLAARLPARLVALGGKDFAAFRLVGRDPEGLVVDLWDRSGTTLHQDLERRDFTVNSFALAARGGEVTDPFGGLVDLGRRVLRATTAASFTGDPLRVLRLPRLLLRLPDFTADPDTMELARQSAPGLAEVAAERVRDELSFLFAHPEADRGLVLLLALDLYPGLWLGRPGEPGRPGTALGELEALPARVRELAALDPAAAAAVDLLAARLASLFANLPAPAAALHRFRDAGYLTRRGADDVALLLQATALPADEIGRRRFLHACAALWPTAACALGSRAAVHGRLEPWRGALSALVELARREGEAIFDPPRLLGGEEVQALLGVPPGPAVGRALAALRAAQVEGRVRSREEALALVRGLAPERDEGEGASPSPLEGGKGTEGSRG
jgi:tRNA nucleotidyltransferase/poly(A) polymerase